MGLSGERRILSIITAVIVAVAASVLIFSSILTITLTNQAYIQKRIVNGDVAAQCEAQLDASFLTLESETSIPIRVFQQVKNDFPVYDTLVRVFQGQYSEEGSTLYSKNMIEYFNTLCTDYLKGNEVSYKKKNVYRAAEKAARLFSDAVGMQNSENAASKLYSLKSAWNKAALISAIVLIICILLISYMYSYKAKASAYLASGISAGACASFLGALMMLIFGTPSRLNITPAVYASAYQGLLRSYVIIVLLVSLAVFAIAYSVLISFEKKIYKKSLK